MLTRIEIDGFKTFRDFTLDVPPFLVVVGRNAAGKSNLFDALQFLRLLAGGSLLDAAGHMRGDLTELFHHHVDGSRMSRMRFAVEVLLDPTVTDAFGDTREVTHSRLRYEVTLELRPSARGERPYVVEEKARVIRQKDDLWLRGRFTPEQRRNLAIYSGRKSALLETTTDEHGRPAFALAQEGRQGRPRFLPAAEATATVLSSLTTATEFPLLYALKREFQSWRPLHLEPAALRAPSSYDDPDVLAPNGAHLANTLRRFVDQTATDERPEGILPDLVADLTAVIPEVVGVDLDEDEGRRQRQVVVRTRDDAPYSSQVASDGTLRAIALLAALYDPEGAGLISFEEPENGIYPHRLVDLVAHLRHQVWRKVMARAGDRAVPLTQLLMSSHSPAILRALRQARAESEPRDDAIFLDTRTRIEPGTPKSRITRARRVDASPEQPLPGTAVSAAELTEFEVTDMLAGQTD